MNASFESCSPEETIAIGREISRLFKAGQQVALVGKLGAGKTCLAKGIISERTGVPINEITSPTFTLMEEFLGDIPIYHLDLYRMDRPEDAEELPWDDLLGPEALTLIEWPEKLPKVLSHCAYRIVFSKTKEGVRNIELIAKDAS